MKEVDPNFSKAAPSLINDSFVKISQQNYPKAQGIANTKEAPDAGSGFFDTKNRLKNRTRTMLIGLILSLSAIIFGYSLKEITSVPIKKIVLEYHITMDPFTTQSILIGVLPLGSVFGAISTKFLMKKYRRLSPMYTFTLINIGAIVLVNITTFITLIIGRFIQGICVGYYTAIAPLYLKEIAPKELRKILGRFFSFGKIIGVLIVIILELIFDKMGFEISWRVLLSLTAGFSVLQAILIFFFTNDTPAELIEKGQNEQARKVISKLYRQEYVDEVYNEYQMEYLIGQAQGDETKSQNLHQNDHVDDKNNYKQASKIQNLQIKQIPTQMDLLEGPRNETKRPKNQEDKQENKIQVKPVVDVEGKKKQTTLTYEQKKRIAYWVGVHLCVLRHFIGGNTIVSQGGVFVTSFDATLGYYTSITINSIQFVFIVIDMLFIQRSVGKRHLFLISISLLSLINMAVAISMIYKKVMVTEILFCIYMVIYGGAFLSPIWVYPSEVIPARQALFPNLMHWICLSISTLIPPLVQKVVADNNPYPVFIFYSFYGFFGFAHIYRYLRQTDGLTYHEIIKSYK